MRVIELDGSIDQVGARLRGAPPRRGRGRRRRRGGHPAGHARRAGVGRCATSSGTCRRPPVPVTVWVGPSGARPARPAPTSPPPRTRLGMAPGHEHRLGDADRERGRGPRRQGAATTRPRSSPRWPRRTGRDAGSYRAMVTDALNLTVAAGAGPERGRDDPAHRDGLRGVARRPPRPRRAHRDGRRADRDGRDALVPARPPGADRPQPGVLPPAAGPGGHRLRDLQPGRDRARRRRRASACCSRSPGSPCCPFQWAGIALLVLAVGLLRRRDPGRRLRGARRWAASSRWRSGGAFLFDSDDPALEPVGRRDRRHRRRRSGAPSRSSARLVLRARRRPSVDRRRGARRRGRARPRRHRPGGRLGARERRDLVAPAPVEVWRSRRGGQVRVVTVHKDDLTLTVEPREG